MKTIVRALALVLGLESFGWLLFFTFHEAAVVPLVIQVVLLFAPPVAFLALLLLVRSLARGRALPDNVRSGIRSAVLMLGPIGAAWSVFRLTQGDESPARIPSGWLAFGSVVAAGYFALFFLVDCLLCGEGGTVAHLLFAVPFFLLTAAYVRQVFSDLGGSQASYWWSAVVIGGGPAGQLLYLFARNQLLSRTS